MRDVDLNLYLVTDSTPAILGKGDLCDVVEQAIKGGVTAVQYREKNAETRDLMTRARALHKVTEKYRVPLLINDRVDVALAIGAEGVHLGQDDMPISAARAILGVHSIIGITVSSVSEARAAQQDGANYIGIGTLFATLTKENTQSVIGTAGAAQILQAINCTKLPSVAIGGINASNVQQVLYQASPGRGRYLSGVAVVSAIVAAEDPQRAAMELKELVLASKKEFYRASSHRAASLRPGVDEEVYRLQYGAAYIVAEHYTKNPLCHNMTNLVVQNFAANVCLAAGSSPIMSNNGEEAPELASLGGALVINMGTVTSESLSNHLVALKAYNNASRPVLLDPVGCGATTVRKNAAKKVMAGGFFDVIKGNESELKTIFGGTDAQQRGVDSGPSSSTLHEKAKLVKELALRERNIILMTGSTDILSDGELTLAIFNGHPLLGEITGSGCALGSVVASFLAVWPKEKLLAVLAAILYYEIAAEKAASMKTVTGPGTFIPVFLDQLSKIKRICRAGHPFWFGNDANIEKVDI